MGSVGQVRSLGLTLQLVAGVSLGPALIPLVRALVLEAEGEGSMSPYFAINAASTIIQLVAGCMLVYGSLRWARAAALLHAIAEIASMIWLYLRLDLDGLWLTQHLILLAWPIAVMLVVWRSSDDRPRVRAEAGGALAVVGLAALGWAPVHAYLWISSAGQLDAQASGNLIASVLPPFLLGLLALRAGSRVIAGAADRAVRTYVLVAITLAVGLTALRTVALIWGSFLSSHWIALLILSGGASLAVPLALGAYARQRGAAAPCDVPDSAAAARTPAWIALWFAIGLCTYVVALLFDDDLRAISRAAIPLLLVLAALNAAAFLSCHRGAARRTMWIASIGGVVALATLAFLWLSSELLYRQVLTGFGWMISAQAAALFVLAWLHRPSARDQRGIEAVFD